MACRTAQEVFADHLERRRTKDLESDLARNYASGVVLLTAFGVFRGLDGVRTSAGILRDAVPDAQYDYRVRLVEGDVAFLEWAAWSETARIEDGVDSFLIRDGRIQVQTIHFRVVPASAPLALGRSAGHVAVGDAG